MAMLLGHKVTLAQCGVTAIRAEFYKRVQPAGGCPAEREDNFVAWCREVTAVQQ